MPRATSRGCCNLCGKSFSKTGITRHLQACTEQTANAKGRTGRRKSLRLAVEGRHLPQYWMHLEDFGKPAAVGPRRFSPTDVA